MGGIKGTYDAKGGKSLHICFLLYFVLVSKNRRWSREDRKKETQGKGEILFQ